jgi:hypothetical protein
LPIARQTDETDLPFPPQPNDLIDRHAQAFRQARLVEHHGINGLNFGQWIHGSALLVGHVRFAPHVRQ